MDSIESIDPINPMNSMKCILIILAVLMIIDLPVILKFNNEMYSKNFKDINGDYDSNIWRVVISGIICYLCIAISIYYFVIGDITYIELAKRSAIFGLLVYGIYNSTTLVTINQYKLETAIVDTMWGMLMIMCSTLLSKYIIDSYIV